MWPNWLLFDYWKPETEKGGWIDGLLATENININISVKIRFVIQQKTTL